MSVSLVTFLVCAFIDSDYKFIKLEYGFPTDSSVSFKILSFILFVWNVQAIHVLIYYIWPSVTVTSHTGRVQM